MNLGGVEIDSALQLSYIMEAIRLGELSQFHNGLLNAYTRLGALQQDKQNDPDQAEKSYTKAVDLARGTNEQYYLARSLMHLGNVQIETGKPDQARKNLEESLALSRESGFEGEIQTIQDDLSKIEYSTGAFRQAYEKLRESFNIKDSLYNENLANILAEADARYELSVKEAEITNQELEISRQKNARNRTLFGGILALLLATGIFQWYYYRQRKKQSDLIIAFNKQLVNAETQALRAQMNPHFIFNALNSIKLYVLNKNPEKGSTYLDAFARLVRSVLQNSKEELIPLEKKLEALELYISLEKLRFAEAYDHAIHLEEDIDADFLQVPPLILQPYAENAIWHGLIPLKNKGALKIDVSNNDHSLMIAIEDNGIGRKRSAEMKTLDLPYKKSMGTEITNERMKLQKHLSGMNISVDTIDLKNDHGEGQGTQVEVLIRY